MRFLLEIHYPETADRPGIAIAQTLREVEPVVERMIPLTPGTVMDRLSGEFKAGWFLVPDAVNIILTTLIPNPTPADGLTVVLECWGENFGPMSKIFINATEQETTFVGIHNIKTTNPVTKRDTAGTWPVSIHNERDPRHPEVSNTVDWVFE